MAEAEVLKADIDKFVADFAPEGPEREAFIERVTLLVGYAIKFGGDRATEKWRGGKAARFLGRKGGRKGGKVRAERMSAERRSEIARKGAAARWRKAEGE